MCPTFDDAGHCWPRFRFAPLSSQQRREAEIHYAMRHENIVRVLAFSEGTPERPPCLVMERMDESLSSFFEEADRPPLVERLEILKDVSQVRFLFHFTTDIFEQHHTCKAYFYGNSSPGFVLG